MTTARETMTERGVNAMTTDGDAAVPDSEALEEWDPMPDELRDDDQADPTPEFEDPMEGPAPTG